jgi:hypothetical protein
MSLATFSAFERILDRTAAVLLVVIGLALGGATALVGA